MPTINEILESDQTNTEEVIDAFKRAFEKELSIHLYVEGVNYDSSQPAALLNFVKALEDNQTVTDLSIGGSPAGLTDEIIDDFVGALKKNKHLTGLSLDPSTHPNMVAKFAQLLEHNQPPLKNVELQLWNPSLRWQTELRSNLKTLAIALEKNKTLETLKIFSMNVSDEEMEALAVALKNHPKLAELNIRGNKTIKAQGILKLAESLKSNRIVRHLSYVGNQLHSAGMSLFVSFLKDNEILSELDLSNNGLDSKDISVLVDVLKKNKGVISLGLQLNSIRNEGAKILADFLKDNNVLTSLNLENNGIEKEGMMAIMRALETNTKLKKIFLGSIDSMGSQPIEALAKTLKQTQTLESLSLSFKKYSIRTLADALQYNDSLTELTLEDSNINSNRLKILIAALQNNEALTTLNLKFNDMSDEDIPFLIELLKNAPNLTALDIRHNAISSKGSRLLADFLETNSPNLNSLKLGSSFSGFESIKDIIEALKKNTMLKEFIFLINTDIVYSHSQERVSAFYQSIIELLKVNKTLISLSIAQPSSGAFSEVYFNIIQALKENKIRAEKEEIELLDKTIQAAVPLFPTVLRKVVEEYVGPAAHIPFKRLTPPKPIILPELNEDLPSSDYTYAMPMGRGATVKSTLPKQASLFALFTRWLRIKWDNFRMFMHNVLNTLKNKFTSPSKLTPHTSSDYQSKSIPSLGQTAQPLGSQEKSVELSPSGSAKQEMLSSSQKPKKK